MGKLNSDYRIRKFHVHFRKKKIGHERRHKMKKVIVLLLLLKQKHLIKISNMTIVYLFWF